MRLARGARPSLRGAHGRGTRSLLLALALVAAIGAIAWGLGSRAALIATIVLGGVLLAWISLLRERREKDSARLRIQYAVARVLSESESLEAAAPRLLEAIAGPLGWELAGLWRIQPEGVLRCVGFWASEAV